MRFEHLLTALRGTRGMDDAKLAAIVRWAEGAKWLLWHGQQQPCVQRLDRRSSVPINRRWQPGHVPLDWAAPAD